MSEILFSCHCGLTLKVHGDERVGTQITCPACNESVTVPTVGKAKVSPSLPVETLPPRGQGKAFVIGYLSVTAVVTLGLVKYLLLPALERAPVVAGADSADKEPGAKPIPRGDRSATREEHEDETTTKEAAENEDRARELASRKAADRDATPASLPSPAAAPLGAAPSTKSADPLADAGSTGAPPETKGSAPARDDSPYAHVANEVARKKLELASELLKKRDPRTISTAELFLKAAEEAAAGNLVVQGEVKKLRDRIALMKGRKR